MDTYLDPIPVKKRAKSGERILLSKLSQQIDELKTGLVNTITTQTEVLNESLNKVDLSLVSKVEVVNPTSIPEVEFPEVQKVEVTNLKKSQELPIYSGVTTPLKEYMAVRLADGDRFYKALDEWMIAASSGAKSGTTSATPNAPLSGQAKVSSTGVAVKISASSRPGSGYIVQALAQNTANVYVGPFGVTTTADGTGNGFELQPGQALGIAIQDIVNLYVNGTANDGVCFIGS